MRRFRTAYARVPRRYAGAQDRSYSYAHSEAMLSRYGIAYVCAHPEILFRGPGRPTSRLVELASGRRPRRSHLVTGACAEPQDKGTCGKADDLLLRLNEACRILNEIYAPFHLATRTARADGGSRMGQLEKQCDDGRPA